MSSPLLVKPTGTPARSTTITPRRAGWGYVGFDLYRLARRRDVRRGATGATRGDPRAGRGQGAASPAPGRDWGELGERMTSSSGRRRTALYLPERHATGRPTATTDCVLAVCTAPGHGGHAAARHRPRGDRR